MADEGTLKSKSTVIGIAEALPADGPYRTCHDCMYLVNELTDNLEAVKVERGDAQRERDRLKKIIDERNKRETGWLHGTFLKRAQVLAFPLSFTTFIMLCLAGLITLADHHQLSDGKLAGYGALLLVWAAITGMIWSN
jgi:hypothetical protein